MIKRVALCVVGHFPSCSMVKMHNIQSASRLLMFSAFCMAGISLFIFTIDFLTCFATVADRFAKCGRVPEEMAQN